MGLIHPAPALNWKKTTWDELEIKFASLCVLKARIKRMSLLSVEDQEDLDNDELESLYYSMLGDKRVGQKTGDAHAVVEFYPREDLPDELAGEVTVKQAVYDCGLFYTSHRPFTGDRITGLWNNPWLAFSPGDVVLILYQPKSTAETPPAGRELYKRLILVGHSTYKDDRVFPVPAFCGIDNLLMNYVVDNANLTFFFVVNDGYIRKIRKKDAPSGFFYDTFFQTHNIYIYNNFGTLTIVGNRSIRYFDYTRAVELIIYEESLHLVCDLTPTVCTKMGIHVSFPRTFGRKFGEGAFIYEFKNRLVEDFCENWDYYYDWGDYARLPVGYAFYWDDEKACPAFINAISTTPDGYEFIYIPTMLERYVTVPFVSEMRGSITVNDFGNVSKGKDYADEIYTTVQQRKREGVYTKSYRVEETNKQVITYNAHSEHEPITLMNLSESVTSASVSLIYSTFDVSSGYENKIKHDENNNCSLEYYDERYPHEEEYKQKAKVEICKGTPYAKTFYFESLYKRKRTFFDDSWMCKTFYTKLEREYVVFLHFDLINDLYAWLEVSIDDEKTSSRSSAGSRYSTDYPYYIYYPSEAYVVVDSYVTMHPEVSLHIKWKDKEYIIESDTLYFVFGGMAPFFKAKCGMYEDHVYSPLIGPDWAKSEKLVNTSRYAQHSDYQSTLEIKKVCENDLELVHGDEIRTTRDYSYGMTDISFKNRYVRRPDIEGKTFCRGIPFYCCCSAQFTGEGDLFFQAPKLGNFTDSVLLYEHYCTARKITGSVENDDVFKSWNCIINKERGLITKELDQITFDVNGNYKI